MDLTQLGEFGFLAQVLPELGTDDPRVIVGPGDDAAVLEVAPGIRLVVTTDAMQEGTHFRSDWWAMRDIGYRATAAAVSDLAAMGARPLGLVVSWSAAPRMSAESARELLAGIAEAGQDAGAPLVGGDIAGAGRLWVALTAFGLQEGERVLLRSGAQPGDALLVSGTIGDSGLALALAQQGRYASGPTGPDEEYLLRRHLRPTPRLREGLLLARQPAVHAAIDVSDGLVQDAGHLATDSRVGVRLWAAAVPLSEPLRRLHPAGSELEARLAAMAAGEDFELLCAVASDQAQVVAELVESETGTPMMVVGEVVAGEGVAVLDETGAAVELARGGWDHFRE